MKKQAPWASRILALALILLGLLPQSVQAQSLTETEGVLRVGLEANYAPFNWSQSDESNGGYPIANSPGEYASGYDVWIARQMADELGMQLELVKIEWDGLPPALMSGKIDAIIAGMSPTEERKKEIDFTDNYYTSDLVMVVRKDSDLANASSTQDFANARVTGQLNTFHYDVLDQIEGLQPETPLDSFPTMIAALKSDKLDAYVSERPGAMAATLANPELTFVEFADGQGFETSEEDTSIAIGVRKGSPLRDELNTVLATISEEERQEGMDLMIYADAGVEPPSESFLQTIANLWNRYGGQFLRGAANTMFISILSTIIGAIIGFIVQVLRLIPIDPKASALKNGLIRIMRFLLNAYIEIFRGTPMMVQAVLIYYGSKLFFGIDMLSMTAAIIIVSINTGAYLAEVVRGGVDSVDAGQKEACMALGLSHWQSMRYVILPQTIRAILPSIANEFVVNIKDTSVLNVISVTELFFVTRSVAGSTYQIFHTYLITAVIYFILTFVTTRIINALGKRSGRVEPFTLSSTTGGKL